MAKTNKPSEGHKPDKLIRDALIAAQRQNPNQLKRIAEKWLELAENGDLQAIVALTDRLDGKVKQSVDNNITGNMTVTATVEFVE